MRAPSLAPRRLTVPSMLLASRSGCVLVRAAAPPGCSSGGSVTALERKEGSDVAMQAAPKRFNRRIAPGVGVQRQREDGPAPDAAAPCHGLRVRFYAADGLVACRPSGNGAAIAGLNDTR